MNLIEGTRRLFHELVAGEIENDETLFLVFLIECLHAFILWCEAATCGRIHNQQHFAFVGTELHQLSVAIAHRKVIDRSLRLQTNTYGQQQDEEKRT